MLPLSSFAAVSPSESGNGRYWTQKSSLKLLNAETTEYVQTGYRLYDTVSSSCVSNATSAGLFSQHSLSGNFFTLSFPKGRDWKVNSNYNLTLRGSAISPEKSEYIYDSLSSEGTSLNYYGFQQTQVYYRKGINKNSTNLLDTVPGNVKLHHSGKSCTIWKYK